jgi:hypothetical protein
MRPSRFLQILCFVDLFMANLHYNISPLIVLLKPRLKKVQQLQLSKLASEIQTYIIPTRREADVKPPCLYVAG